MNIYIIKKTTSPLKESYCKILPNLDENHLNQGLKKLALKNHQKLARNTPLCHEDSKIQALP